MCELLEVGCGSTMPVMEFAVIGLGVAVVITFFMRT